MLLVIGTVVRQIFIELAGFLFLSLKVLSVTIFISVLPYRNFAVRRKEIDMTTSQASAIKNKLRNMNLKGLNKEQQNDVAQMIIEALKLIDK